VTYLSLDHGLIGRALLGSPLGGAMMDWIGLDTLFAVLLISALVAVIPSTGLGSSGNNANRQGTDRLFLRRVRSSARSWQRFKYLIVTRCDAVSRIRR